MDKNKVRRLLKREEGFKLDFKLRLNLETETDKRELAKDVIAIANTSGGRGYILFGIEDHTKRVIGLTGISKNIEERIQQVIRGRSMPPVPVSFDIVSIEGKKIGILTIYKSMQVPHQMIQTGAFYVRRGSTTDKAIRHEIANMLQQFGMVSFENIPCRSGRLEDLDEKLIQSIIGKINLEQIQDRMILCSLGILATDLEVEVYYPTYGGLLLFGKMPQDFIPQSTLEVTYGERCIGIKGNIMSMLNSFEEIVQKLIPSKYPLEAILEIVTNALIHRSYWNNALCTYVFINEAYISVSNPMSHKYKKIKGIDGEQIRGFI